MHDDQKLQILLAKIQALSDKQANVQAELAALKREVTSLLSTTPSPLTEEKLPSVEAPDSLTDDNKPSITEKSKSTPEKAETPPQQKRFKQRIPQSMRHLLDKEGKVKQRLPQSMAANADTTVRTNPPTTKSSKPAPKPIAWEAYIGQNLLSKIGILIIIIGVAIGAKYAIDNDLVSPLMRIIMGYVVGLGLLGTAIYTKEKYPSYSAVLLSGAMTILYFITFFAYTLYALIPLSLTFGLMVIFTIFTVIAAIQYNRQIIALLGIVGAYAVPFLLSSDSGDTTILLSYIALLNVGIMVIAVKRYWKALFYVTFIMTWLIFGVCMIESPEKGLLELFGFAFIFFTIFYVTFLVYKFIQKEKFIIGDFLPLVFNSLIFFVVGLITLEVTPQYKLARFMGLFALLNAAIHFVVSVFVYRSKLADRTLFFFISALVLIFLTIAVPLQLEGNWVTIFWAGEMVLFFYLGRKFGVSAYEKLAYPLIAIVFCSLLYRWGETYAKSKFLEEPHTFANILNPHFLVSMIVVAAYAFMTWLNKQFPLPAIAAPETNQEVKKRSFNLQGALNIVLPCLFLACLFLTFANEVQYFWEKILHHSTAVQQSDGTLLYYSQSENTNYRFMYGLSSMMYTCIFLIGLSIVNIIWLKKRLPSWINLIVNGVMMFTFLTAGLGLIGEMRALYIEDANAWYFISRYACILISAVLLGVSYYLGKQKHLNKPLDHILEIACHIWFLTIISNEIIHWLQIQGSPNADKLALSIWWGIYAIGLIAYGLIRQKKYLRLGGILVFAVTLIKLFFYDLQHLDTLPKTVIFVTVGISLLIGSFLYNKYQERMEE